MREDDARRVHYTDEFRSRLSERGQDDFVRSLFARVADQPLLNQMLYLDTKTWLPDDLLIKADKVTMGSSLELRVPLLDHKVMEFAASLPPEFKVRGREIKRVLKAAFSRVIPAQIINRKKVGFPVPYGRWLAGDLWARARDLLMDPASTVPRYFDRESVERLLKCHRDNVTFFSSQMVFSLLALEFWHRVPSAWNAPDSTVGQQPVTLPTASPIGSSIEPG
jgi:asparagine synthase (glutamine-hydrolysing)